MQVRFLPPALLTMSFTAFYLVALIPVVVGAFIWIKDHEVVWFEWLIGSVSSFALVALIHALSINSSTSDIQTVSGVVKCAVYHPRWVEEYHVTVTHGSGKNSYTTTEPKYTTHRPWWEAVTTVDSYEISEGFYEQIKTKFGVDTPEKEWTFKSGFYSGDHNLYYVNNLTGYVYPATSTRRWTNKIKVVPTVFSYAPVPTNVAVFPWPSNPDWLKSDRLVGTSSALFDQREFDLMNSRLGPNKKVNVIMVGWGREDATFAQYQEAAWVGGKKNDLVICFGGLTKKKPAAWARVFGWTESNECKRNIETLLLNNPASGKLLSDIEREISRNYKIKDWTKFDYITVPPPAWAVWVLVISLFVTQGGLWWYFRTNGSSKPGRFGKPFFRNVHGRRR